MVESSQLGVISIESLARWRSVVMELKIEIKKMWVKGSSGPGCMETGYRCY